MGGTETVMIKIYKEDFGKCDLGMSSTLSVTVFILFIFIQKHLVKGLNTGGVKE